MITIYLNALICLLIAIRLFTFNREDNKYKLSFGLLAWAMICSSSAIFIFSCFGFMDRVDIAQTIMNSLLLICILKTHGNVAKVSTPLKSTPELKVVEQKVRHQ